MTIQEVISKQIARHSTELQRRLEEYRDALLREIEYGKPGDLACMAGLNTLLCQVKVLEAKREALVELEDELGEKSIH